MTTYPRNPAVRAFTLVETLVAIAILTMAITGPLIAAQRSIVAANTASQQLIASSLAQEGLEFVRQVRDNNYLANATNQSGYDPFAGMDGSPANCVSPNYCVVDPDYAPSSANAIHACTAGSCASQPLYLSASGHYNQQQSGTPTTFVRSVTLIKSLSSPNVVRATVTVTWTTSGTRYSTQPISEDFYGWL